MPFQPSKNWRKHAAKDAANARDYLFHAYVFAMRATLDAGELDKYEAERALLRELWADVNARLEALEAKA